MLLFNLNFSYLETSKDAGSKLGIFFVLKDFVPMNVANNEVEFRDGWHYIAWAFVQPFPAINSNSNTERENHRMRKKARLQLYHCGRRDRKIDLAEQAKLRLVL